MEEEDIKVSNKIKEFEGLESLINASLPNCEYKSDVVIVFAHFLLTQELDFECAEIQIERDENGEEKKVYKTMNSLPADWKKDQRKYRIIYKNETETRVLTAQKHSREIVIYFSNEEFDQSKISSKILLNKYIPNQFLTKQNDLSLIDNLNELRNVLLACFSKTDKIKAKQEHDKNLIQQHGVTVRVGKSKKAKKLFPIVNNDSNHTFNPLLRNERGNAKPGFFTSECDFANKIGQLTLQDDNKHKPVEENFVRICLDDPDYILVDEPTGPPDERYIK